MFLVAEIAVVLLLAPSVSVASQHVTGQEQLIVPREALTVFGVGYQPRRFVRVVVQGVEVDGLVETRCEHRRAEW